MTHGKLVECTGASMTKLLGHMLARPPADMQLDGGLAASPENAVKLIRDAPRLLVLLGSGASAGYGVPINLATSSEADPLVRYGPVRQAVLALGEEDIDGLYHHLASLLLAVRPGAFVRDGQLLGTSTAVVSTNIDDLATRAGLPELQLHGTTGRLQCAPCDLTWGAGREWPPDNCPMCGRRPLCNVPTDTLNEDDVVWRWIHQDQREARRLLDEAAGAPLTVVAIGMAMHVHTLTPELQLLVQGRALRADRTSVVWINLTGHGGALPGAMELRGDAAETVTRMLRAAKQ